MNRGRLAGLLYVVASLVGIFGLLYVPGKLIVSGDATTTAHHIANAETLFRLGIAAHLLGETLFVFAALALYDLLKPVNPRAALWMLTLILLAIPLACLNELNAVAALLLIRGSAFAAHLGEPARDALAMLFLNLRGYGFDIAGIFWGLWLFPLGYLAYRSGRIPRALGAALIVNGFAFPIDSFMSLVLPAYAAHVHAWMRPLHLGEQIFMLWLLIVGAKPLSIPAPTASVAATSPRTGASCAIST